MTEYAYKWVSALLMGEPDYKAARRATEHGWEPVPETEVPPEMLEGPYHFPQFALHRMALEEYQHVLDYYAELRARALARPTETTEDEIQCMLEDHFYPSFSESGEAWHPGFKSSPSHAGHEPGRFWTDDNRSVLEQTNDLRARLHKQPLTGEQIHAEWRQLAKGGRHSSERPALLLFGEEYDRLHPGD